MRRTRALGPLLVLSTVLAVPCPAQTDRGPRPLSAVDRLIAEGDSLRGLLRPLDAIERYDEALTLDDAHFDALWKAAREAVTLGMLAADEDAAMDWYRRAEDYARRAVEVDRGRAEGHEWLGIAVGRRALGEGPRTRATLSEEIREHAMAALAVDSLSAAAHHVLGEWHAEIRRLPGVARFFARKLLGAGAMSEASWEAAEHHLRRATELAPTSPVHHLALARVFLDTGRPELARQHLVTVMELPPTEATDPLHQQKARELLDELRNG